MEIMINPLKEGYFYLGKPIFYKNIYILKLIDFHI